MKLFTGGGLEPSLHTKVLVPGNAFKEWVNHANDHTRGHELGPELGPLGNAAGNDGGNGRSKCEQEKELDQVVTVLGGQLLCTHKEVCAIGHGITHHKVRDGGHREVHKNFWTSALTWFFFLRNRFLAPEKAKPACMANTMMPPNKMNRASRALF
jgi:hypothetical protein